MVDLAQAVGLLRAGELVAIPTETVYGLAADARSPQAVAKIFAAKGRPADHPLIVHVSDMAQLPSWAVQIPDSAYALASSFWPGPLTLILKRHPDVPDAVTGGQNTVGLRVPAHPLALTLLREFGSGIAAPSANKFGRISPTTAQHVRDEFGDSLPVLDGGACAVGIESTIVDLSRETPAILRPGQISRAAIAEVIGDIMKSGSMEQGTDPRVSGSLEAHYAPGTSLQLVTPADLAATVQQALARGLRVAVLARHTAPAGAPAAVWDCAPAAAPAYAHDLYASLRRLDALCCDLIVVEAPPPHAEWAGIADRLRRAAAGSGTILPSRFAANGR